LGQVVRTELLEGFLADLVQDVRFLRLCCYIATHVKTPCNNLVDIIRLAGRLFQHVRYIHDITILLQPCVVNLVTFFLYHDCIRLVRTTL
jgi:hypothetical protein